MKKQNFNLLSPRGTSAQAQQRVIRCHNLQPNDAGCLQPVQAPGIVASSGWRPVASVSVNGADKPVTVCSNDSRLGILNGNIVLNTFDLDGPAKCVLSPAPGKLVVMTADRLYRLEVSEDSISGGEWNRPSVPVLRTEDAGQVSATVGAIKLGTTYTTSSRLAPSDRRLIADALNDAYRDLDLGARNLGLWWQPVMAKVVLLDSSGKVIGCGLPTLLMHPDGKQFDGSVELQSDDGRTTAETIVSAPAWKIKVVFDDNANLDGVAAIEVRVTPMLHRGDPDGEGTVTLRRRADDRYFCRAVMSQSTTGVWAAAPASRAGLVSDLVARFDSVATTALTVADVVAVGGTVADVPSPSHSDPETDIAALRTALRRAVGRQSAAKAFISAYHRFTAETVACDGPTVMWGNLKHLPAPAPSVADLATATGSGQWYAYTSVDFADGSRLVTTSQGNGDAPERFGPLLAYPSPDAVSITVSVMIAGVTYRETYPLSPDSSGMYSIYVNPNFTPFSLPKVSGLLTPPLPVAREVTFQGCLAVSSVSSPLSITGLTCINADIAGIMPASAGQSGWNFGRSRFYVTGMKGILSACVNSARNSVSVSSLDCRPVMSAAASVTDGDKVYVCAGGDLVCLSGTKVSTIAPGVNAGAVTMDRNRHEVWCVCDSDSGCIVEVICLDRGMSRYTFSLDIDPALTRNIGNDCYVASDKVCYRPGDGASSPSRSVEWQADRDVDSRDVTETSVEFDIQGDVSELTLETRRVYVDHVAPDADWRAVVQNEIRSPLRRNMRLARANGIRCSVSGTVRPSFRLKSFHIV